MSFTFSFAADSISYNIEYGLAGSKPLPEQGVPLSASANKAGGPATAKKSSADLEEGEIVIPPTFRLLPEVEQAARDANAYDFITSFKAGFATHCGDRGSQLSGGQKQRIAVARALVRQPEVMLFDEATAALDSQSEQLVQASIDRLVTEAAASGGARTIVIIAHRLASIRFVDRICVLDRDGGLVEEGTFDELMARPGSAFSKMAAAQGDVPLAAADSTPVTPVAQ
jgi:ABC-type multidrug transport system fused ATPase/permease subunit